MDSPSAVHLTTAPLFHDQVVATLGAPSSTQLLIQRGVIAAAAALGRLRIGPWLGQQRALKGAS